MKHVPRWFTFVPWLVAAVGIGMCVWWLRPAGVELRLRVPGTDAAPGVQSGGVNPVSSGKVLAGPGQPAGIPGAWPQFRGPNRDGIAAEPVRKMPDWKSSPPRELWSLDVGEGYAGVAAQAGRVFLLDYDRDAKLSVMRCLSLADGREIWRYSYPLTIKRNHGMTRTVPVATEQLVVGFDSKCNVFCLDASNGELKWTASLVREFGATVPEWYASQCPLVDGDRVILAPGGKDALLIALDLLSGKLVWRCPNPHDWKMTHSSIMPMEIAGRRSYVYCASKGVVGVDASDGTLLWETADWKISIATVPSPLPLPGGMVFLTGGYGAGSMMVQLEEQDGRFIPKTVFRLAPEVFGATQHTPIFAKGRLYGTRADGRFVCLGLDGKVIWASGADASFGLGAFLMQGDLLYALNDSGQLSLIDISRGGYTLLAQARPLNGRESWAPMALVGGRLLLRDLTRLVCLGIEAE